ncbi:hypothetical protein [Sporohalobacter salinus]|uniref:hypothetical protein n=1 Tax=Sporohalobacter salinus TaxID=1494606 RepID=UPI0019600E81|nr:hypothetical protein [Sporohalobacter salinus]MBM7624826.1 hypothetical protein [Sporohalobacter salinus]
MAFKDNWKDIIIVILGIGLTQIICGILVVNLFSMDCLTKGKFLVVLFSVFIGGIIYAFRYNQIVYCDILLILGLLSVSSIFKTIKVRTSAIIGFFSCIGIGLLVFRLGIFTGYLINRNNQQEIKNNKM